MSVWQSVVPREEEEGVWSVFFLLASYASVSHPIQIYEFAIILDEKDVNCS